MTKGRKPTCRAFFMASIVQIRLIRDESLTAIKRLNDTGSRIQSYFTTRADDVMHSAFVCCNYRSQSRPLSCTAKCNVTGAVRTQLRRSLRCKLLNVEFLERVRACRSGRGKAWQAWLAAAIRSETATATFMATYIANYWLCASNSA